MLDVTALGELLIDFTYCSADEDGYPTMAAHPGGAPANFLAALAKLGAKTALLGKVGDDAFGRMLKDTLKKAGVETQGLISSPEVFTTLAFVTLDEKGDREFSFARKPGADTCIRFEELDMGLIDQAKTFHFGTLSLTDEPARSCTCKAVAYAKERGKLISFDPNLRRPLWRSEDEAREQMLWGLGRADIVKISDEEVRFLFGLDPAAGAEHILKTFGPKLVFVTCGAEGCVYRSAKASGRVPALPGVVVRDTTGAGDIFGGSALWMILQTGKDLAVLTGEEIDRAVRFATVSAGLSTTRNGGIQSIPSYGEIMARMDLV